MSDVQPTKIKHRPLLDGTRGVMMCVVLGYHLKGVTKLPGAWVSMDFFFVLSGYLITTLLVKEYEQSGRLDLRTFFRRRVRRLGPALLAVLAVVFVVAWAFGGPKEFPGLRGDGLATLFYVANWHFIFSATSYFDAGDGSVLRHAWSLAIEEQFYVIWPLVFLGLAKLTRFDKRKMLVGLGVCLVASALWMRHLAGGSVDLSRAYYGTDTRGQGLIVGSMMALVLWKDRWDTPRAREVAGWLGTVALAGLVAMMLLFHDNSRAVYTRGGFLLITLTAAVFIFGCARAERGPLAWIFGNKVSRHMGFVSYSFYLWHYPVIVLLSPPRLDLTPWLLDSTRVLVALGLAEATYWFLEKPIHQQRWQLRRQGPVLGTAFAGALALLLVVTLTPAPEQIPTKAGENASGATTAQASGDVLVMGDSLAWLLSGTAPKDYPYQVQGLFQAHCDIIGDRIYTGSTVDQAVADCPEWPTRWEQALDGGNPAIDGKPDAIVVSLGLRQLFDVDEDGTRVVVGTPAWEREYRAAVDRAAGIIRARTKVPVFWLDVPCYQWEAAETDGEERDATRIATVNRVLKDELASFADITVLPYGKRVCSGPGGTEPDLGLRPDGAHLTPEAAGDFWHWLEPQIRRASA
ncbi:acyltransferase [Aquihabitans sp. G128]|uniref:acyltransferase family protein n=1 Tax=Aquihabitans sp. G128 TaxID=2849779 RepID=UPI001C2384F0|nr:acyltransferase family protein [Aquihabitans sp. G128]QXC60181.1 acyltransferase [Aquihabitans sp. G128]